MITVKDIREKEFSKQKHGYHEDEVDDFLDEIADQMEALIRENRSLLDQLEQAKAEQAAPVQAVAPAPAYTAPVPVPAAEPAKASEPTVDEPSYFRNLEATLRETLISAQRIADETVAEARKKAKQLVSGAESQAETIVSDSRKQAEDAKAELANVKKVTEEYRARFVRLVQEQMHALKLDDDALLEEDK